MSTILDEKEKPTVFPLLTGGLAVGFLRLWICGHRTIFQFVGTNAGTSLDCA